MINTCVECGKEFEMHYKRKYCSQGCRRIGKPPLPEKEHKCINCGVMFTSLQKRKYCSSKCHGDKLSRKLPEHAPIMCKICGKEFIPFSDNNYVCKDPSCKKACSVESSRIYRAKRKLLNSNFH